MPLMFPKTLFWGIQNSSKRNCFFGCQHEQFHFVTCIEAWRSWRRLKTHTNMVNWSHMTVWGAHGNIFTEAKPKIKYVVCCKYISLYFGGGFTFHPQLQYAPNLWVERFAAKQITFGGYFIPLTNKCYSIFTFKQMEIDLSTWQSWLLNWGSF